LTKVVFWLPAINPYWRDRFNALEKDGRVDFECWFNSHLDLTRSWTVDTDSLQFPHTFLPKRSLLARYLEAARRYRISAPEMIFTFHSDPGLWPAWIHRLRGRHLTLYALMTWDSWVDRTRLKEFAKRIFFSSASYALTPGRDSDAYVRKYGAKAVGRLHHAVDVTALREASKQRSEVDELRFLFLGRFVEDKGVPFLLELVRILDDRQLPVSITAVGSGPLESMIRDQADLTPGRLALRPFVQADRLPELLAEFDVLLFPTTGDPYGLVVDEALAAGMPVISSPYAGDIGSRLSEGRGWVIDTDAPRKWADRIQELHADRSGLSLASRAALEFSEGHDLDRWTEEIFKWSSLR
jgi:glycosyltransferase involved in cell wall biosynthesis